MTSLAESTENTIPKSSPWGQIDGAQTLAPGIVTVSTPGHGGIHLDRKHSAIIKKLLGDSFKNFLDSWTWWEEDCDWAIPWIVFFHEIKEHIESAPGMDWEREHLMNNYHAALKTIDRFHKELCGKIVSCAA